MFPHAGRPTREKATKDSKKGVAKKVSGTNWAVWWTTEWAYVGEATVLAAPMPGSDRFPMLSGAEGRF